MAELNGKLNLGFTKVDESTQNEWTSLKLEVTTPAPPPLTVVGSGEFGQAFATCLTRAGHKVLIASRNPDRLSLDPRVGTAVPLADGIAASQVVVMAVPRSVLTDLLKHQALHGKIVVDVSNRTDTNKPVSQYDSLGEEAQAETHPDTRVVKAFNTLSAYALRSGVQQGGKQVPFCGNDAQAKQVVVELIRSLGYIPEDRGDIRQSKELEDIPFAFFEGWLLPLLLAFAIFIFFYTVFLFRLELCPHWDDDRPWDKSNWDRMILLQTHLSIALTALTLLVSCYIPGVIAAYLQLFRGTKYSRFPRWLDRWLTSRKQMGLIALQLALTHAFAVLSRPEYQGKWRISSVYLSGVFAFGLMVILGVSSLPSVGATLSWREFNFLQRWGGWSALTFATLHAIFVKWDKLIENDFRCVVIPNQVQIVVILPLLTILFKLPLLLPWVDRHLMNIRAGKTSSNKTNFMTHFITSGQEVQQEQGTLQDAADTAVGRPPLQEYHGREEKQEQVTLQDAADTAVGRPPLQEHHGQEDPQEQGTLKDAADTAAGRPPLQEHHGREDKQEQGTLKDAADTAVGRPPLHEHHGREDKQEQGTLKDAVDTVVGRPPLQEHHGQEDPQEQGTLKDAADIALGRPPLHEHHGRDDQVEQGTFSGTCTEQGSGTSAEIVAADDGGEK